MREYRLLRRLEHARGLCTGRDRRGDFEMLDAAAAAALAVLIEALPNIEVLEVLVETSDINRRVLGPLVERWREFEGNPG